MGRGCRLRRKLRFIGISFRVTRKGTPLERLKVKAGNVKFSWIFHLRRVAQWRGLTWEYFRELDIDDQAAYAAEYAIEHELEYHDAVDRMRKERRMARRGK